MIEIYDRNREALSQVNPSLVQFMDGLSLDNYQLSVCQSEAKLSIQMTSGTPVVIDEKLDAVGGYKDLIPDLPQNEPLIVVFGMGLGGLLKAVISRYPMANVLVIEHDPRLFRCALKSSDLSDLILDPKIQFLVGVKPESLTGQIAAYFMRKVVGRTLPSLTLVQNPDIVKYSKDFYKTVTEKISEATNFYWDSHVGNSYEDSLIGARHIFENLTMYDKMISSQPYQDLFRGKPGIVVSSGPSLNNKLEYLKSIQDKAVILCVDSALNRLLKNGIKPFGVVSLERGERLPEVYRGYDIPDDIVLFMVPQIKPDIVKEFSGPVCLLFRDVFPFRQLPDLLPKINWGSSAAHMGLLALRLFGIEDIALIGQDLAFDRQTGKSHYEGVIGYAADFDSALDRIEVPDNNGGTIHTHIYWRLFRDIFSLICRSLPHLDVKNVIEKEKGAFIPGTRLIDPETYFATLNDCDVFSSTLDLSKGRKALQDRKQWFFSEWEEKRKHLLQGLITLRQLINSISKLSTIEKYKEFKLHLESSVSVDVFDLFDTLFISSNRRFDSLVWSMWNDTEFNDGKKIYIDQVNEGMDELIAILEKATY